VADIYANIPDVDSRGIPGQIGKFKTWNPNPVGNEAANLGKINPQLSAIVAQARQDNPNLNFVLGNGRRTAADQNLAKSWGWSKVGANGGGDANLHMHGNAMDLWGLDANGQVQFDPGQQKEIGTAIKAAADKLGVKVNWGGDWQSFKDAPHFELAGDPKWSGMNATGSTAPSGGTSAGSATTTAPGASSSASSSAQPAPGTTINSSSVIDTLSRNIAGIESGGAKDPYTVLNPKTHAIGKYQVMPSNVAGWTQAALGQSMTPEEFRASPSAQEAVFRDQMQRSLQLYGPKDAASIWFTGKPYNVAGGAVSDGQTTNANYVARATAGLNDDGTFKPGAAVAASAATPGTTLNSSPVAAGAPAAAPPTQALAGFQAGSPAEKSMLAAGKTLGLGGQGGGQQQEPQPMQLDPVRAAAPAGGPMMLGPGGQNTVGQRLAQNDLAQRMAQYGVSTQPMVAGANSFTPTMGMMQPPGTQPMAQPGAVTGLPQMPGTTLNSPSQLQMAMLSGSLDPYALYARQPGS
jgi:hypothetical protein